MKTRERSCAYMCKDDTSQSYIGSIWKKKKKKKKDKKNRQDTSNI